MNFHSDEIINIILYVDTSFKYLALPEFMNAVVQIYDYLIVLLKSVLMPVINSFTLARYSTGNPNTLPVIKMNELLFTFVHVLET